MPAPAAKCQVGDKCSHDAVARVADTKQAICGLCLGDVILSTAPPRGQGVPAFTSLWAEPVNRHAPGTIGVKPLVDIGRVSLAVPEYPLRLPRVAAFKVGCALLEHALLMGREPPIPADAFRDSDIAEMTKAFQLFYDRILGNDIPF